MLQSSSCLTETGWHWSRWKKGAWSNWCIWLSKKKLLVWKAAPKTCREHIPWFCTSIESNPAWTCTSQHSWISSLAASWWRRIVERNREESWKVPPKCSHLVIVPAGVKQGLSSAISEWLAIQHIPNRSKSPKARDQSVQPSSSLQQDHHFIHVNYSKYSLSICVSQLVRLGQYLPNIIYSLLTCSSTSCWGPMSNFLLLSRACKKNVEARFWECASGKAKPLEYGGNRRTGPWTGKPWPYGSPPTVPRFHGSDR